METKFWICDVCGERITDPQHGWVEWITFDGEKGPRKGRNLRLVHHRPSSPRPHGCQFNSDVEFKKDRGIISDLALPRLLGPDGLMELLELLHSKAIPADEITEMIKRLHVPGYEIARRYLLEAADEGVYERTAPGFPDSEDIQAIITWAKETGRDS